ncbi:MAG TPA: DUF421 domain-containing protein [Ignavibacteria bacterium]|nr:DUF421 domain-containing protein [Ignavibacteria bacterium]
MSWIKSIKLRKFSKGLPATLVKDGRLLESKIQNEKLTAYNLCRAIRLKGLKNIDELELAVLETEHNSQK